MVVSEPGRFRAGGPSSASLIAFKYFLYASVSPGVVASITSPQDPWRGLRAR